MGRLIISMGSYALIAYNAGNSDNTIDYLRYLLHQSPNQRLLLFWDGASYHHSHLVQNFLGEINQGLSQEDGYKLYENMRLIHPKN